MPLIDLVAPNAILPALKVNNKKQALQEIAARAAVLTGQNERAIFRCMRPEPFARRGVRELMAVLFVDLRQSNLSGGCRRHGKNRIERFRVLGRTQLVGDRRVA